MAFFAIGIILSQLKNEDERLYQLHYLITHEKWDEAITFMQKKPVQNVLMSSYTNIALLHQQRLSKELFSYFQVAHVNEFWSSNHLLNYLTAETYFQLDMLYAPDLYVHGRTRKLPSGRSRSSLHNWRRRIQKGKTGCQPQICGLTGVYLILQRLGLQI